MSAFARSRSLRKPETSDSGPKKRADSSQDTLPNVSPSRLPVKGMMPPPSSTASITSGLRTRAASTAITSGDGSGNTTVATARNRPMSGVFGLGRSASVRQPAATSPSTASTATSRPPITSRSRPATRPTSPSRPSPVSSRPTTSSGLPSSATTGRLAGAGHARTKSSATTLTGATTLRPPSQPSSSTAPAHAPTAIGRTTRSATLTSRSTHTRAPSTSSTSTASTTTAVIPPPRKRNQAQSEDSVVSYAPRPVHRLPPKPAFSTLQQHYSPAKNLAPKPLTSTYLAPPSPSKLPSNVAISAETARLQTELLQLHLLHRDADTVCASWRDSARQKLGQRFHDVAATEREIAAAESEVVDRGNVAALKHWGGNELEEKIRLLDVVLTTVWAWNETGGKYARTVRRFERWAEKMVGVVEARGYHVPVGQEMVFISDLDASWKDDCGSLVRKLREWRDVLVQDLWVEEIQGEEQVPSSLDRILGGLRGLMEDMLAELALMRDIEREAVMQENEWVKGMNRRGDDGGNDTRAGAIWRVL